MANGMAAQAALEQAARAAVTEVKRLAPKKRGFFGYRQAVRFVRARIVGTTLEAGVEVRSPGWHLPEYGTTEYRATAPLRRGVTAAGIDFREE